MSIKEKSILILFLLVVNLALTYIVIAVDAVSKFGFIETVSSFEYISLSRVSLNIIRDYILIYVGINGLLIMYYILLTGKNKRKWRKGSEYGSSEWGNKKDYMKLSKGGRKWWPF